LPWLESAQRSLALRMFSQYVTSGVEERPSSSVSWVFPGPWYRDELDWMAAARAQAASAPRVTDHMMLTTRGTYVARALPAALHEYVAPSLSVSRAQDDVLDAYSPLVPFAATQAAQMMARAVAPLAAPPSSGVPQHQMSAGLRAVFATMLERAK